MRRYLTAALLAVAVPVGASGQGTTIHAGTATLRSPGGGSLTMVTETDNDDPSGVAGTHLRIAAEGEFPAGVTVTFHWKDDALPGGVRRDQLAPMQWSSDAWSPLRAQTQGGDSVVIAVTQPGAYAIRWAGPATPCTDSAYRALDYRLGTWNYRAEGYDPGRTELLEAPTRCAIYERYEDVTGGRSRSFWIYVADEHRWYVTTWDPSGRSVMKGTAWPDSAAFYHSPTDREVYRRAADGTVRFAGERSTDAGQRWAAWVTAVYRRPLE